MELNLIWRNRPVTIFAPDGIEADWHASLDKLDSVEKWETNHASV